MPVPLETFKPELTTILTHMNHSNYLKSNIVLRCPDYKNNVVKLTISIGEESDKVIHLITLDNVRENYYRITINHSTSVVITESKIRILQEHDFDFSVCFLDGQGNRKDTFGHFPQDLKILMELE